MMFAMFEKVEYNQNICLDYCNEILIYNILRLSVMYVILLMLLLCVIEHFINICYSLNIKSNIAENSR